MGMSEVTLPEGANIHDREKIMVMASWLVLTNEGPHSQVYVDARRVTAVRDRHDDTRGSIGSVVFLDDGNQWVVAENAQQVIHAIVEATRSSGAPEWQHIETAPKDGKEIIGWESGRFICWWAEDGSGWDDGRYSPGGRPNPTLWHPLPEPPR